MNYCPFCMNPIEETASFCTKCGKNLQEEAPAHHLLPGTVLHDKFLVGAALGEGGFGITYIGRDTLLDMRVAIKEYFPNGYVSRSNTASAGVSVSTGEQRRDFFDKGKERFLKEARILAKFSREPGVVEVRDFFEANNTAYIVMEYLSGETLKSHIRRNGPLTPEQTMALLSPVMNSLKKVHQQGLIHRDISPDNIMLLDDGGVKLLDFGAARNVSAEAQKSLSVMLKPGYAPEEQYRSKGNQGPWTDVYALSATIYKCITGITPDDSTQRAFSDELKTPTELGIPADPVFERALMRGLGIFQKDRYQTVDALLDGFAGKDPVPSAAGDDDDERTIGVSGDLPTYPNLPRTPNTASVEPAYRGNTTAPVTGYPVTGYPVTGARVTSAPAVAPAVAPATAPAEKPAKKKKMPKGLKIALIVLAAVLAVAAVITVLDLTGVFSGGKEEVLDPDKYDYNDELVGKWKGKMDLAFFDTDLDKYTDTDTVCGVTITCDKDGSFTCSFTKSDAVRIFKGKLMTDWGCDSESEADEYCLDRYDQSFDEYVEENLSDFSIAMEYSEGEYEVDGDILSLNGVECMQISMTKSTLRFLENKDYPYTPVCKLTRVK